MKILLGLLLLTVPNAFALSLVVTAPIWKLLLASAVMSIWQVIISKIVNEI